MNRIQIADTIIEKDGKILMLRRNFKPKGKLDLMAVMLMKTNVTVNNQKVPRFIFIKND